MYSGQERSGAYIDLSSPPQVASAGLAVHGLHSSRDRYELPHLWQLHLYRYEGDLIVNGHPFRIHPGSVSLVPPGATLEFRYLGRSEHYYAHFRAAAAGAEQAKFVPYIQSASNRAPGLGDLMASVVGAVAHQPVHAAAELWSALWRVADLAAHAETQSTHPSVARALAYIDTRLAERLVVADIARDAAISGNQLTRLFRSHTGLTVVGYIRMQRMQQAQHLLSESTIPVAAVATSVGIPDLHAFNKACRREFGYSPRQLRDRTLRRGWAEEHSMTSDTQVAKYREGISLLPGEVRNG